MGKREPQIILKTDERKILLELGLGGKFAAKSTGWDENRVFLEGDQLEVAVKNGRWVLTHTFRPAPADSREPVERITSRPTDVDAATAAATPLRCQRRAKRPLRPAFTDGCRGRRRCRR